MKKLTTGSVLRTLYDHASTGVMSQERLINEHVFADYCIGQNGWIDRATVCRIIANNGKLPRVLVHHYIYEEGRERLLNDIINRVIPLYVSHHALEAVCRTILDLIDADAYLHHVDRDRLRSVCDLDHLTRDQAAQLVTDVLYWVIHNQ